MRFDVPSARLAFTDRRGVRSVEPGLVELWVGPDCATREATASVVLTGEVSPIGAETRRTVLTEVVREDARVAVL